MRKLTPQIREGILDLPAPELTELLEEARKLSIVTGKKLSSCLDHLYQRKVAQDNTPEEELEDLLEALTAPPSDEFRVQGQDPEETADLVGELKKKIDKAKKKTKDERFKLVWPGYLLAIRMLRLSSTQLDLLDAQEHEAITLFLNEYNEMLRNGDYVFENQQQAVQAVGNHVQTWGLQQQQKKQPPLPDIALDQTGGLKQNYSIKLGNNGGPTKPAQLDTAWDGIANMLTGRKIKRLTPQEYGLYNTLYNSGHLYDVRGIIRKTKTLTKK